VTTKKQKGVQAGGEKISGKKISARHPPTSQKDVCEDTDEKGGLGAHLQASVCTARKQ